MNYNTANFKWRWAAAVILCLVMLLSGLFYWYELRPANIRKECKEKVRMQFIEKDIKTSEESLAAFDSLYKICVHGKGLEN